MKIEVKAVPGESLYLLSASGSIELLTVSALYINPHGSVWMYCTKKVGNAEMRRSYPESDIGTKLFKSREEAEAMKHERIIGI